MKRDLIIRLVLDEAEQEQFRCRWAMVLPLTAEEAAGLGTDVILTHDGLAVIADSLIAFAEGRELYGTPDPELKEALEGMAGQLRQLCGRMDRVRQIIGRGKFVGEGDGFPKTKGPVQ